MRQLRRWFRQSAAALLLAAALAVPNGGKAQEPAVDLALILAIDCSFSVDAREFQLQMEGLGRAFMSPEVKAAIAKGNRQRIAVTAIQWSDERNHMTIVPWTIIAGDADADEFGTIIAATPRRLAEGGTSISSALYFAEALFQTAPAADRQVIDVSSDGRNNIGPPVNLARDRIVRKGITINGLVILNEWPTLDKYFEANVVGGPANFVMPTADYVTYAEAILRKLVREITGPGIS